MALSWLAAAFLQPAFSQPPGRIDDEDLAKRPVACAHTFELKALRESFSSLWRSLAACLQDYLRPVEPVRRFLEHGAFCEFPAVDARNLSRRPGPLKGALSLQSFRI